MKAFVALIALPAAVLGAYCSSQHVGNNAPGQNSVVWTIEADGVPDRASTCGGLWDNLHCTVFFPDCSGDGGHLSWSFTTSEFCNYGDVDSAWWRATQNQFGSINC